MTIEIPIGQVKRDISELVNRVAYQGERIILTSRASPRRCWLACRIIPAFRRAIPVWLGAAPGWQELQPWLPASGSGEAGKIWM